MRISCLFSLVLTAALAASAAGVKPSAQPGTGKAAAQLTQTAAAAGALSPAEIMKGLQTLDDSLENLSCDFVQDVSYGDTGLTQTIEGSLRFKKPGMLRIEHFKPYRQLVYTDKKNIWIYKPADAQAVKMDWDEWKKSLDPSMSGMLDFGNYSRLLETHSAAVSSGAAGGLITVALTPKKNPALYTLTLQLSEKDYFPMKLSLLIDKTSVSTELKNIDRKTPVDAAQFEFKPPRGVEVLQFGAGGR